MSIKVNRETAVETLIVNGVFRANQQDALLAMDDDTFSTVESLAIKANAEAGVSIPAGAEGGTGGASKSKSDTDENENGADADDVETAKLEDDKDACPTCGKCKTNEDVILDVPTFIANAPEAIRGALEDMHSAHEAKRLSLVKGLKSNARCQYTEQELADKSMPELTKLAALAAIKPDFSGQAGAPKVNEAKRTGFAPPVPKMEFAIRK